MSLANNPPVNTRAVRDINYITNIALPVAANTVNSNALDLIQSTPYSTTQYVQAQILTGSSNNTANSKNINVTLQQTGANSDGTPDNGNWVNIPTLIHPLLTVTDNGGGTTPAGNATVSLPPNVARFIRAQAVGEANGGNAANANLTLQLLF